MKRYKAFEWFKLGNYDSVREFTLYDWCNAVLNRIHFSYLLRNGTELDKCSEYWNLVREYGVEKNHPPEQWKGDHNPETVQEVLTLIQNGYGKGSIKDVTDWDVMAATFEREDIEDVIRDWNVFIGEDIAWLSVYFDFEKNRNNVAKWEQRKKLYEKYRTLFSAEGMGVIEVDLAASDEQLKNDFANWLALQRTAEPTRRKTRITEKDFDEWREAKVLQYFDLVTISELDGIHISNHVLGNLLFPDEIDVDVGERVRKVTRKKAQQVFSEDTLDILQAQK